MLPNMKLVGCVSAPALTEAQRESSGITQVLSTNGGDCSDCCSLGK